MRTSGLVYQGSQPCRGPIATQGRLKQANGYPQLAFTFGTLRANDLIWRYVVDSYLKGATPDAFDLLYWDSDSVSLPGPMYCWYTRNTYLWRIRRSRPKDWLPSTHGRTQLKALAHAVGSAPAMGPGT